MLYMFKDTFANFTETFVHLSGLSWVNRNTYNCGFGVQICLINGSVSVYFLRMNESLLKQKRINSPKAYIIRFRRSSISFRYS